MSDVILGVTDAAGAGARVWAVRRAEALGLPLRELLIAPTRDDADTAAAATTDAEILVLPAEHGHSYHALIAHAHSPVAVVPDPRGETGADDAPRSGVLVGVDPSDVSARALAFAAIEAERAGEPLIALAAWEPVSVGTEPGLDLWTGPMPVDLTEATAGMLERMLEPVRSRHPQLEVRTRIDVGDASALIEEGSRSAVLTVVGSHGRTGLSRLLLGSVSEHVAAHVGSPTVIVR
ncbi:universal stress protein [Microbacterium sp. cf332]|uniref:universal stress protein n=1 Tax=Microbacterium sp. cf332 TaxID=1761804 RepID=UPI000885F407|nr:universal stress protein [Microbacterium sp. cf332]SDQ43991.1 Nucleotide-binding universal stress protein, UspA family [Microbacterium sp. cf332]